MNRYLRINNKAGLALLEGERYEGVALGVEFCPSRLPSPEEVAEVAGFCAGEGLGFSLVTPLVREAECEPFKRWLRRVLGLSEGGLECVFNDLGMLAEFSGVGAIIPAAGRLIGRQRRGPRVVAMVKDSGEEDGEALKGSLWDDPEIFGLFEGLGVARIELDLLLQGESSPVLPAGGGLTVCAPWALVTLSPSCPWTDDPLNCGKPCEGNDAACMENSENSEKLWSCGNALFVKNVGDLELRAERMGADRLCWSPEIPA